ncbi:MAG: aminotransferase class V-fold PLP-dependent enzyme, partial [Planctomycetota bacterium]
TVLDVDDDGVVKPDTVASAITEQTRLVCVSAASGIFGTRQLIREIADRCHQHGVPLHCDASHIPGHILMDLRGTRADTISISGHRMYGPKGTGALMVRSGYSLTPIVYGSCSEMTLRAGSENVTGWVGLGTAATLCSRIEEDVTARLASMRDMFVQVLREELGAAAKVHCESSDRLPNTVCISLPTDAAAALQKHPEIVVGRGHDSDTCCVFHRSLQAIGCDTKEESRSMCISLGWTTSEEQVCYAAERLAMSCV